LNPTLLILVLAMGAIWVAFIRPQKRRQQLQRQMLDTIQPGAEVITAAGLYGKVVEAEGDVRIARRAIGAVIPPEEEEASEPEEEEALEPEAEAPASEDAEAEAAQEPRS
jgi:preprotein translocase subunit YajC